MRAYSELYLQDAMDNVAIMMDYAVNYLGMDRTDFYSRFLNSRMAELLSKGHPRYVAGMSGIELAHLVLQETGEERQTMEYVAFNRSADYWTGWALAYISWYFAMGFKELSIRGVDASWLMERYTVLHEADISKCAAIAGECLAKARTCPLKRIRKAAGYTQEALSTASGVSLRMIRAYEQQSQPIVHAEYQSLRRLSSVLGCKIRDLTDYRADI